MNLDEPIHDDSRPQCVDSINSLMRLLDGETVVETPELIAHRANCADCRDEWSLAPLLAKSSKLSVVVPSELTAKTVNQVTRDRRVRQVRRWVVSVFSSTAAVLLVGFFASSLMNHSAHQQQVVEVKRSLPVVDEANSIQEVRSVMASLTEKVVPERPKLELPSVTLPEVEPVLVNEPAWDQLADATDGLKTGVKPLTTTAQRAVNMLFRSAETFAFSKPNQR